jgi:hypothetical protein
MEFILGFWNKQTAKKFNNVGGIPTLAPGEYRGVFVGAIDDEHSASKMIILHVKNTDGHTELTDIDVDDLKPGDQVRFEISMRDGPTAQMRGSKIQLVHDNETLTDWLTPQQMHNHLIDNNIKPAEPKLTTITKDGR